MNSHTHIYFVKLPIQLSLFALFSVVVLSSFVKIVDAQSITLLEESRGLYLGVKPGQNKYAPGKNVKISSNVSNHMGWISSDEGYWQDFYSRKPILII